MDTLTNTSGITPREADGVITLIVDVTAEDQMCGVPKNCSLCPVATALNRALPSWAGLNTAFVTGFGATFLGERNRKGGMCSAELPDALKAFIRATDEGKEMPELPGPQELTFRWSTYQQMLDKEQDENF